MTGKWQPCPLHCHNKFISKLVVVLSKNKAMYISKYVKFKIAQFDAVL